MAYTVAENMLLAQPIADNSTTQKHAIGQIVKAKDPTYGVGEFIYLVGVASTLVGTVVTWHDAVATQYGWYQISGIAVVGKANTLSLAPGVDLAIATGLAIAATTTNRVNGLNTSITASASTLVITVPCLIERPTGPGVG